MIEIKQEMTLGKLSLIYRVLFTAFLLTIGLGLSMAGAQIMLTHGMADGKPGLSMDDPCESLSHNSQMKKISFCRILPEESPVSGACEPGLDSGSWRRLRQCCEIV